MKHTLTILLTVQQLATLTDESNVWPSHQAVELPKRTSLWGATASCFERYKGIAAPTTETPIPPSTEH